MDDWNQKVGSQGNGDTIGDHLREITERKTKEHSGKGLSTSRRRLCPPSPDPAGFTGWRAANWGWTSPTATMRRQVRHTPDFGETSASGSKLTPTILSKAPFALGTTDFISRVFGLEPAFHRAHAAPARGHENEASSCSLARRRLGPCLGRTGAYHLRQEVGQKTCTNAKLSPGEPSRCPQSDSNRHLADFKSAASANWAMGAFDHQLR